MKKISTQLSKLEKEEGMRNLAEKIIKNLLDEKYCLVKISGVPSSSVSQKARRVYQIVEDNCIGKFVVHMEEKERDKNYNIAFVFEVTFRY